MNPRLLFASLFSVAALAGAALPAAAADLTVMPTSLRIAPPKAADIVTIRNNGRAPVKMQIRLFQWQQKGGKDVYYPTQTVIASPPFVVIKGGSDGNIRVARVAKTPVQGIESYRLIIDELPSSRVRAKITGRSASVEVVTRQILPVIFTSTPETPAGMKGAASVASQITFSSKAAKGGVYITIANKSAEIVNIGDVALLAGGQEVGKSSSTVGNILPKSAKKVFVPAKGGGEPDQIKVLSGKGTQGTYPLQ